MHFRVSIPKKKNNGGQWPFWENLFKAYYQAHVDYKLSRFVSLVVRANFGKILQRLKILLPWL